MIKRNTRRSIALSLISATGLVAGCRSTAPNPPASGATNTKPAAAPVTVDLNNRSLSYPPILLVHGNGDTAALWHTTIWRFESNGWPANRLFAFDFNFPQARTNDDIAQEGRSSTSDQLTELSEEVERVRKMTGAAKVILIGSSRGGFAIRNYLKNGNGRTTVLAAVLCGTPNQGVWRSASFNPQSEFNGSGRFLTALNTPQGNSGALVPAGIPVLTIRSDRNDKFAQPDGIWIGQPNVPTGVTFDGPALKGATNVVLPNRDHRETAFHAEAFAAMYQFLTGNAPARTTIAIESRVSLNGKVPRLSNRDTGELSNLPLVGATVSVFEVQASNGERIGNAVHKKTVGADGQWGPFLGQSNAYYEFVIEAAGFSITHIYRSPFARSSQWIQLRPGRIANTDRDAQSLIFMTRPRGYFGLNRDRMSQDGKPLAGIVSGVPGVSTAKLKIVARTPRPIINEFNNERIAVQQWPTKENRIVYAEFHE
jgi:triacylglycerol lipase